MPSPPARAADALFDLSIPVAQPLIGLLVLAAVIVSVYRLLQRGPSRMVGAMLLIGGAVICLAVISYLLADLTGSD